ncbi:hypothetical protein M3P19_03310 [Muricauda sp. 2012CJ35-5]|uniref:Uncharacterized protein n=1 Tax=Flagellimonas spongiicola TaxID=2942208 RepID=A0ABT0PNR1_9FLAO|nr:hypothetical protein [Allomuricauda spongiicola]MCL6273019.1 hypothetical protein [Allomuricauda spongiicola]
MKKILFILTAVLFISCDKDDTDLTCLSDCTLIQGQFLTSKGAPLQNVNVSINYYESHGIGASIRRIKKAKTDENGNFQMKFYINNDELGKVPGYFQFVYDYSELDSEVFIDSSEYNSYVIGSIYSRDTIIDVEFYNPKKAYITINLNNFIPTNQDDFFTVSSLYPIGRRIGQNQFISSPYQLGYDGNKAFATAIYTTVDSVLVAESDYNRLSIMKRKNGGETLEENHEIFVPVDSSIVLDYDY